jgi:rRNA-processing protein FCF1
VFRPLRFSHLSRAHPPLPQIQVLLDGNFVAVAERLKMEWRRLLPKLLDVPEGQCHLHLTECALAELHGLGAEHEAAREAARALPLLKCRHKHGHGASMDAGACARALVGPRNEGTWLVATQDAALRGHLRREVPGCPIILISNNVLVLEAPGEASKSSAERAEVEKTGLSEAEAAAVKNAVRVLAGAGGKPTAAAAAAAAAAGAAGGAGAGAGAGAAGGFPAPQRRGKSPSAPNPLSNLKKKRRRSEGGGGGGGDGGPGARPPADAAAAAGAAALEEDRERRKKNRRKLATGKGGAGAGAGAGGGFVGNA